MTLIELDSFLPLFEILSLNKRKFPARLLRKLKESVYDLVLTNDSKNNLVVQDIDSIEEGRPIDVVFGVGTINSVGYTSLSRNDLCFDILFPEKGFSQKQGYSAKKVLHEAYPRLTGQYIPVFKYLRDAGYDSEDKVKEANLNAKALVSARRNQEKFGTESYRKKYIKKGATLESLKIEGIDGVLYAAALLPTSSINIDLLLKILRDNYETYINPTNVANKNRQTAFYKLICLYDYLKFGGESTVETINQDKNKVAAKLRPILNKVAAKKV